MQTPILGVGPRLGYAYGVMRFSEGNRGSSPLYRRGGGTSDHGDGCIDFQAVSNSLAAMSYSGWIVVEAEQDPAKAPPYDYSKMGYDHIVKVCKKADISIN